MLRLHHAHAARWRDTQGRAGKVDGEWFQMGRRGGSHRVRGNSITQFMETYREEGSIKCIRVDDDPYHSSTSISWLSLT